MVPIALGGESKKCSFHVRSFDSAVWHDKRDGKSTETSGPCQNVASRLQNIRKKEKQKNVYEVITTPGGHFLPGGQKDNIFWV